MAKRRYVTTRSTTNADGTTRTTETIRTQGGCSRFIGWCLVIALVASGLIALIHAL